MGAILEQVIIDTPALAKAIFPSLDKTAIGKIKNGNAQIAIEWSFPGQNNKRRIADLAIVEAEKAIALCEIKYEDHLSPGNRAQLDDYLHYAKKEGAAFTYLTQYTPPQSSMERLAKAKARNIDAEHLYYRELYGKIENLEGQTISMFRDFLKDQHVIYKNHLDRRAQKSLQYLMASGLYIRHNHGMGALKDEETVRGGPKLLGDLLGNSASLADWFRSEMPDIFSQRFRPSFGFEPIFLDKAKFQGDSDWRYIEPKHRSGGYFWVFADGRIPVPSPQYLGMNIGYEFELDVDADGVDQKIEGSLIVNIWGRGFESQKAYKVFKLEPDLSFSEAKAKKAVARLAKTVLGQTLAKNLPVPTKKKLTLLHDAASKLNQRLLARKS